MLLFADYETYWDQDYTLKRMTPAEYILDRRFAAHGMAINMGAVLPKWIPGENIQATFDLLKPVAPRVTMITFNALFDMCITAWRYGFVPGLMIDVLGMVRARYGMHTPRHSLDATAEFLKIAGKHNGGAVLQATKGMRLPVIRQYGLEQDLITYGLQDVQVMVDIFRHIEPTFPPSEYKVMDLVLRCAVQPQFKYDHNLLKLHLHEVQTNKANLLAACGLAYDEHGRCPELMSTLKFAALLEGRGVAVEMKTSPTTGKDLPALSKTDDFMASLLEHEDETVAALAAARLGHKSTLEETRTQRFLSIASLPSASGYVGGSAPIPLRYAAAHTQRLGGEWSLNKQNLPRKSNLRKAIVALGDDEEIVSADESQIEARLSAWIAGEKTLLREFAENIDPYGQLGATVFGLQWTPDFKKLYPVERFIGKTGILGLGYGAGARKFHTMVLTSARTQLGTVLDFTADQAQNVVNIYRNRYWRMPFTWNFLQNFAIPALLGEAKPLTFGPVIFRKEEIEGPNGQCIYYPDLKLDLALQEYTYQAGAQRARLYGPKLLENIVQWLARIVVMDAGVRLAKQGLRYGLQAHDELVFAVKKVDVPVAKRLIYTEMVRRPAWAPDAPLDAEVHSGPNYGEAK